ncbi:DUF6046 domain-containing protein [Xanthovirga aplysinae]|uniref:DUF6046 domain-containing protein n=1 Tax=Xanthovirga aplysinae TaxID=2529853 RepID=UPI0012BD2816|nr:DUF6046 domain-containing protein [Xanthovirga aplysinae]MTI33153.1 hypothetical protein [Xanthovirga aplysinae]
MATYTFVVNNGTNQGGVDQQSYTVDESGIHLDSSIPISQLGTPVLSRLKFPAQKGVKELLLDTVIISVSMQRTIVKTAIQGQEGTVKEFISDGDYSINIKGSITSTIPTQYPEEEVSRLIKLCKIPDSLVFDCDFLAQFGSFYLVVENYKLDQQEGFSNVQNFELNCISDKPLELKESEEKKNEKTI